MKKRGCWGLLWQTARGTGRTPGQGTKILLVSLHSQEKKRGLGGSSGRSSGSSGGRFGSVGQAYSLRHVFLSSPRSHFSLWTRSAHLPCWVVPVDDLLLTFGLPSEVPWLQQPLCPVLASSPDPWRQFLVPPAMSWRPRGHPGSLDPAPAPCGLSPLRFTS